MAKFPIHKNLSPAKGSRPVSRVRLVRGDTLVEVLLAVLIVSTVLTAAYVSVSRNLGSARTSQERGEAVQLTQGQLEIVRSLAHKGNEEIFDESAGLFCVDSAENVIRFSIDTLPPLDSDNFGTYPNECRGVNGLYNVSIDYEDTTSLFIATIRWDKLGGGRNEAVIYYRIHQGLPVAAAPSCTQNNNIALLLDRSTSMNKNLADSETPKWQALKNAATLFVELTDFSPTANKAAVLGFFKEAEEYISMTGDKEQLLDFMNAMGPAEEGGTDYYKGLAAVDAELEESGSFDDPGRQPVVVMMTDGGHNTSSDPLVVASELKAKGAAIYTIGLFDDIWFTPEYQQLLEDIAGNGGYFLDSTTESELINAYEEIAEHIACG